MKGRSVRRRLSWLVLSLLVLAGSWSCEMPSGGSGSTASATSSSEEAERTRKMEEKAAEIERMAADIQTMQGTEQEKIDAVNRLDEARRELQRMQESGSGN